MYVLCIYNLVNGKNGENDEMKGIPKTQIINGNLTELSVWLICQNFLNYSGWQSAKHLKSINQEDKFFLVCCTF